MIFVPKSAEDGKRYSPSIFDYLTAGFIPLLCFFVTPINVVANNLGDLQHLDFYMAIAGFLGLSTLGAVLAIVGLKVVSKTPANAIFLILCKFGLIFFTLTGLVAPLTVSLGQVETSAIPVNWANLMFAASIAALVALVFAPKLQRLVLTSAMLFAVLIGGFAAGAVLTSRSTDAFQHLTEASSEKNVFVVSFDGLSRDLTREVLLTDEALLQTFKDFTVFAGVVGSAPSTTASLASETLGGVDLKALYDTETNMLSTVDRNTSITSKLAQSGFNVAVYGTYADTFNQPENVVQPLTIGNTPVREKINSIGAVFELAMARLVSPVLAFGPRPAKLITDAMADESDDWVDAVSRSHAGASWDIPNVLSVRDFHSYVEGLRVGTSKPSAHFMHFLHTHYPVDFDRACQYRSDDPQWHSTNQNLDGMRGETYCALTQFGAFLDKLRDLGIYQNALIVLKSDHGTPFWYQDPSSMASFQVRGHDYWGYDRYTPWLIIKPSGQDQVEVGFDTQPRALSDLAVTICLAALPRDDCDSFQGYDALNVASIPYDAHYIVNLLTGPEATYQMDTHESVVLRREPDFYLTLTEYLSGEILTSPLTCDERISLISGEPFNNGLTADGQWMTWGDRAHHYLRWSAATCEVSRAQITVQSVGLSIDDLVVSVDGAVQTLKEVDGGTGEQTLTVELVGPLGRDPHTLQVSLRSDISQFQLEGVRLLSGHE